MKKVTVVITNYNTKELLKDCVLNLEGKYSNLELIIIDNDSPDGSAQMVKENFVNDKYPWITLVESPNNGLANAYNLALDLALDSDYYLFLGADAFPEEGTISGMVAWLEEHESVGIATCKLIQRDGSLDFDAHRGFPTPWVALSHFLYLDRLFPHSRFFNGYFLGFKDFGAPHEIDLCISHFMFVKKEVFNRIGRWDKAYWLYGEDVDICWRAKQAGFEIFYLPQWKATHYKGTSIGVRRGSADITKATALDKFKSHKASVASMKLFYEKHWQQRYPKVLTVFVFFAISIIGLYRKFKLYVERLRLHDKLPL